MTFALLLEASLRSFLLALAVWIGLRVFRVRNVHAQKAAWGVVLVSALAMPVVLPMASHWSVLPANVRVVIPADPENMLEELRARIQATPAPAAQHASGNADSALQAEPQSHPSAAQREAASEDQPAQTKSSSLKPDLAARAQQQVSVQPVSVQPQRSSYPATAPHASRLALPSVLSMLLISYFAVAITLLIRVAIGLAAALRLRRAAKPISADALTPLTGFLELARSGRIRSTASVASPVTICSTIVLPVDYSSWENEKLRIVLAHESSHIRQSDFYLQLLTAVYAAVVWFSPLGWWLKRKLSDLAEAISDRAGLEEASDRASYAQVLLEFAAVPRPTLIGVAMARSGSLSRRIERLLNDVSFRQAFAGTRRSIAAVLTIPFALFVASVLIRVQAVGQTPAAPPAPAAAPKTPGVIAPPAPAEAVLPISGVSTPDQVAAPPAPAASQPPVPAAAATPLPAPATAPQLPPEPPAAFAEPPVMTIVPLAPPPAGGMIMFAPKAPGSVAKVMVLPAVSSGITIRPMAMIAPGSGYGMGNGQSSSTQSGTVMHSQNGKRSSYRYSYSTAGDSYAIVRGDGSGQMSFNGDIHTSEIDKARKQAHGDFLWFTRDDKPYIVDDPATISQIEAMYKPMEDLGRQQEELGKRQEALGRQQEELGKQQESASVPTPDMSKEIAAVEEAIAKLKADQGKNLTQDQFSELQEKVAELQGRIGEMQAGIGAKQGQFGERMGALGAKMGELGAQQGELGARQGKIAQDADQRVRFIIEQSLKDGKAHPVQ